MSKKYGTTRLVRPYTSKADNAVEFNKLRRNGNLDLSLSFVDSKTGVYLAYMQGHEYHEEELEVARAMVKHGINVVLTPEGSGHEMYATNIIQRKDGNVKYKYSEGKLSIYTYEQKTPKEIVDTKDITVANAIKHANSKRSDIAVLYDRYDLFNRNDIEQGMKYYQERNHGWQYKAKALIVVNSKGGVFEHHFDE